MKLAYLEALGKGGLPPRHPRDPYDILAPQLETSAVGKVKAAGKVPMEEWLTPRPSARCRTMLSPGRFREFIDADGCREYARRIEGFVKAEVLPKRPLMLGVDHSQSAGAIGALSSFYGRDELRVIVLDAHSDVLSTARRRRLYRLLKEGGCSDALSGEEGAFPGGEDADSFNCGSFLHHLVAEGRVDPRRLLLLGPADLPPEESPRGGWSEAGLAALEDFRRLGALGVSFLGRGRLRREGGLEELREALEALGRGPCYVSLDLDVGSLDAVRACRFMDLFGLGEGEIAAVVAELGSWLQKEGNQLVGLDVMEMDVHLVGMRHRDGSRDRTARVAARAAGRLLGAG